MYLIIDLDERVSYRKLRLTKHQHTPEVMITVMTVPPTGYTLYLPYELMIDRVLGETE